jgi:DNA polymerase-1
LAPDAGPLAPKTLARDADAWPLYRTFKIDNVDGYVEPGAKAAKRQRDITLKGLGLPVVARTELGWPAVSARVLRELAGKPEGSSPKYGLAFEHFGGGDAGKSACEALYAL